MFPCVRCPELYLVGKEEVVCQMQDAVHVDNAADALHIHVGYQAQDHHGLHKQLPVLGLGYMVQDRLHLNGKLDFPGCHLQAKHNFTHGAKLSPPARRKRTSLVVEEGSTYPSIERPWHFWRIFQTFW